MRWEWVLSAAVHALLLLGAAIVFNCWTVCAGSPQGRPEFVCAVQPPGLNLTLPAPTPDCRIEEPPASEGRAAFDEVTRGPQGRDAQPYLDWFIVCYNEDSKFCGTCLDEIVQEYQGRVVWKYVPKAPPIPKTPVYAEWCASRRNNRSGQPHLNPQE
jgi:hypothetical protein